MGIVRSSVQAAFGSKDTLKLRVMDLYSQKAVAFIDGAVAERTAFDVCRSHLNADCDVFCDLAWPTGYFLAESFASAGRGAAIAHREGVARPMTHEQMLEGRFRRAQEDEDLALTVDPRTLAECLTTVANGLAVRADMGSSREDLHRIVEGSLRWLA